MLYLKHHPIHGYKEERRRISERTKAGLKTAKKKGKRIGAPPKTHLTDDITRLLVCKGIISRTDKPKINSIKSVATIPYPTKTT